MLSSISYKEGIMAAKVTSTSEYANKLLKLIFNATNYANMADNAASSPFTSLYVSLHTSSPGATGNQTTNEAAYGSYARVAVTRDTGGWTVTGASVSPVANIVFAQASSGSETETHFGVGTSSTGTGHLLYFGTISPNISVTTGVIPTLTTATFVSES
jgi:hypothetical protein